jgi:hypothetical protein
MIGIEWPVSFSEFYWSVYFRSSTKRATNTWLSLSHSLFLRQILRSARSGAKGSLFFIRFFPITIHFVVQSERKYKLKF